MKLFLGNLHFRAEQEDLRDFFAENGVNLTEIAFVMDKETQRFRGFAFAVIEAKDSERAFDLSGQEFMGRGLVVNEAQEKRRDDNRGYYR